MVSPAESQTRQATADSPRLVWPAKGITDPAGHLEILWRGRRTYERNLERLGRRRANLVAMPDEPCVREMLAGVDQNIATVKRFIERDRRSLAAYAIWARHGGVARGYSRGLHRRASGGRVPTRARGSRRSSASSRAGPGSDDPGEPPGEPDPPGLARPGALA